MKKVLYEELLPEECVQRIKEMPVAYLPLGTLEWHGPHMPLELLTGSSQKNCAGVGKGRWCSASDAVHGT